MERQISFAVKISLQETVMRRSVMNLWCETEVWSSMMEMKSESLHAGELPAKFGTAIRVKQKIMGLVIAERIKKRMMDIFMSVGADLMRWKVFHENLLHFSFKSLNVLQYLRLTSAGTVDYLSTAEELVRLGPLNDLARYTLSCYYCLVDYIPVLWQEIPAESRDHLLSTSFISHGRFELTAYWAWFIQKNSTMYDAARAVLSADFSFHQHAFLDSVLSGNKAAAEHFYQKLTSEEQIISVSRAIEAVLSNEGRHLHRMHSDFPKEKLPDVFCYLLSLMSPEQQMQVLRERPSAFLSCFSAWPYQDVCMEISSVIMAFPPEAMNIR